MAGNHRSGRRKLPTALHVLRGSYRRDRHGPAPIDPMEELLRHRDGIVPDTVDERQSPADEHWIEPTDDKAKELYAALLGSDVGVAIEATDSAMLTTLCEVHSLLMRAVELAKQDPIDRNARSAVVAYGAMFDKLASRFGMTPSDRERLRIPTPPVPGKLDRFLDGGSRIAKRKRG